MRDPGWKRIEWRCEGCSRIVDKPRDSPDREPILCATCLEEEDVVHELNFDHKRN